MEQSSLQPNLVPEGPGAGRERGIFGAAIILVGLGAGLAASAFMGLLHAVQHLAWSYGSGSFLNAVAHASTWRIAAVLAGAGLLVAVGGVILRRATGGHGGEIYEAIWSKGAKIPFLSTLGKAAFSIVVVGLGAALGREGAPKQAGAAWGSLLAERFGLSDEQRKVLVACGAGAGMGAIYNVPLGGALFALEILLGGITVRHVLPAFGASALATMTTWFFLPNRPTYDIGHQEATWASIPGSIVIGILAGLLSVIYLQLIGYADLKQTSRSFGITSPILVFIGLAAAAIFYPGVLGNGKDVVQLAFTGKIGLSLSALLLVLRTLATTACLNARTPGGLFTPTITVGALMGLLAGYGWKLAFPAEALSTYALLGATAFWAACSKGPLSALVLIMELTGHLQELLVPLILAVAAAMLISRRFDPRSIYTVRIHHQDGTLRASGQSHRAKTSAPDGGRIFGPLFLS